MDANTNRNDSYLGNVSAITDEDLADWLTSKLNSQVTVAYLHSTHQCKLFEPEATSTSIFPADPGKLSLALMKRIAKAGRLRRLEMDSTQFEAATTIDCSWALLPAKQEDVSKWHKEREKLFGKGRGKPISPQTAAQVWHAAAGACMYRGCGADLGHTPLTTKAAQVAYLAHIVGSDPDGPRGGQDSHILSDNHENIMLMCDGHHRLIDRIDCAGHSVERLNAMREEHVHRARNLLSGLRYPRTQIITLLANLAQVSTNISQSDLHESVLSRRLGPLQTTFHAIRRTQRDDRGRLGFWNNLLHEHESDIRDLILKTNAHPATGGEAAAEVLAIFPIHLVPVLVLSGRIIGEARSVEVFQYNRDRRSWQWSNVSSASPSGSIFTSLLPEGQSDEVLLTIELTATVNEAAFSSYLTARTSEGMPWIRVLHKTPNFNCISTPEDLKEFTNVARQVVQYIHDKMKAKHVHLIGISPASTLFRFGQLLQAGHHPMYELYDRPDGAHEFVSAILITGDQVKSSSTENQLSHAILLK